jgi:Dyp-type peroxidase family
MPTNIPVREAPFSPMPQKLQPQDPVEPELRVEQIQGNILAGFNKDNQTLLFLKITDQKRFKAWLRVVLPFVATVDEVLKFNRLFKQIRTRRGVETRTVLATWLNIAFSFQGLAQITDDADRIKDLAFKEGLANRSKSLNDPVQGEGSPKKWVIGGKSTEADVVIIIGSDSAEEMEASVASWESSIDGSGPLRGQSGPSGARVIFKQRGATLPDPLRGHEHFGFLDGVSQPGIRGTFGANRELLTPKQNPADPGQGKPGQDRLWPGEFVFGYPAQDPTSTDNPGKVRKGGVEWMENGSFLVFRRLRQDVGAFHQFLQNTGNELNLGPELFGAKCVGRWESGAPVERANKQDNAAMSRDDCANNAFDFQKDTIPKNPPPGSSDQCKDNFPNNLAKKDVDGLVCPFAGHIRKAYPRDDVSLNPKGVKVPPNEADTETHRLLRRGIPFGTPFDPTIPSDDGNRGLLFIAYQTSIENQFEFVIKNWVNNPDFKENDSGHDPVLGQSDRSNRERSFKVPLGKGQEQVVRLPQDFVIPTGGGYFFAPSIRALERFSE